MGTLRRLVHSAYGRYDHVDADAGEVPFTTPVDARICPCCTSPLVEFVHGTDPNRRSLHTWLCSACGWWHMHRIEASLTQDNRIIRATWWELYHAVYSEVPAELSHFTTQQLQTHLQRRWEDRKHVSAQQTEDLVAELLREHYRGDILRVSANALSSDGGIDLYVIHDNGAVRRAVQVKRRQERDTESVQEVRNFVGAMLLDGTERGVFVTTASRFTRPAAAVPSNSNLARSRLSLDLIDGRKLYELLESANRQRPLSLPEYVEPTQEWIGPGGRIYRTEDLFLGDLQRLLKLTPNNIK